MAIDNVLRVSVRIDLTVGNKPFAMADLSLPAWSSLAEVLEEVLDLTGAPTISRPWVARTATGIPIDPGIPLSHTQLEQGGVLVLSPERDLPAPVIRDAAEALVELSSSTRTIGLVDLLTLTGLATVAVLLAGPVAGGVDPGIRMLILAVICVIILVWLPRSTAPEAATPVTRVVLPVFITLLAATAALVTVVDPLSGTTGELAWGLVCASGAGLTAVLLLHLVFTPVLMVSATLTTLLLLAPVAAAGAGLSRADDDVSGPAAITIAVIMVLLGAAPKLSAALAGLRVPTLPTAGQDLSVSDNGMTDPTAAATRAQTLYDAQVLALSLTGALLIFVSSGPGTWFTTLFALVTTIACLLHAIRQSRAVPTWSLMVLACAALITTVVSASRQEDSWVAVVVGVLIAALAVTVAVWIPRIPTPEPTTIVWLERIESICVAATLPLALHLLDVFGMLRALNIGMGG